MFLQEHFRKNVGPLCRPSSRSRPNISEAANKLKAPTLVLRSGEGFDCFNTAWLPFVSGYGFGSTIRPFGFEMACGDPGASVTLVEVTVST